MTSLTSLNSAYVNSVQERIETLNRFQSAYSLRKEACRVRMLNFPIQRGYPYIIVL